MVYQPYSGRTLRYLVINYFLPWQNINITNFSSSWANGLAFCALTHHFYPDAFDYNTLDARNRRHNLDLAFRVAEWVFDSFSPQTNLPSRLINWRGDYLQGTRRRMPSVGNGRHDHDEGQARLEVCLHLRSESLPEVQDPGLDDAKSSSIHARLCIYTQIQVADAHAWCRIICLCIPIWPVMEFKAR